MLNFKSDGLSNVKRDIIIEAMIKGGTDRTGDLYWGFKGSDVDRSKYFYHMDLGYWHEVPGRPVRGTTNKSCYKWRISRNAYFNNELADVPYDRLTLPTPKKWNKSGRYIIVCPGSKYINDILKLENWQNDTVNDIRSKTDRPIIIHAKGENKLPDLLKDAYCVVTAYSKSTIDAVLQGIPVFSKSDSFASPISSDDYEDLKYPEADFIRHWLANLSWKQFNVDELRSGFALEKMEQYYGK